MARVFIDSFETQNLDIWDFGGGTSIVSTAGLSLKGNYCLRCNDPSHTRGKYVPARNDYYFAFWLRTTYLNAFLHLRHGATELLRLQFQSTSEGSKMAVIVWGSQHVDYNNSVLHYYNDVSYFMQVYLKIDNVGRVYVKRDGVVDRNFTGDTLDIYTDIDNFYFQGRNYIDNVVVDSSIMPEETEISILMPNGVGAFSEWSTSASGNNYTFVDELPYNDSDFVSSGIVNAIDTYALEDLPSNTRSVKCVQIQARARKDSDSPLTKFNFVTRHNSTNYHNSDVTLSDVFSTYSVMYAEGPTGSGVWHPTNVNPMEIGVRTRV